MIFCKKKRKIKRKDFLVFAEEIGIESVTAEKLLTKVIKEKETLLAMTDDSYLTETMKIRLKEIISTRISSLSE